MRGLVEKDKVKEFQVTVKIGSRLEGRVRTPGLMEWWSDGSGLGLSIVRKILLVHGGCNENIILGLGNFCRSRSMGM